MPGIIVGSDGSDHSRRALDWAIREAAFRHTPLNVLTVQQPIVGYWAGPVVSQPVDQDLKQTAGMAQKETQAALEQAGNGARPPSVTVKAVAGLPAEQLLQAAADSDMLVVGSRGAGGFRRLLMGSVSTQVTHTPAARSWSSPTATSEPEETAMSSTVKDVMSTHVIAVRPNAPYKEMAAMLHDQRVSAFPVIDDDNKVIGVISEADLLTKETLEGTVPRSLLSLQENVRKQTNAVIAADLMTKPAVTIGPDETVTRAARLMFDKRVKRLPVTSEDGTLIGIVSRADVLSVYSVPDAQIQREVSQDLILGTLLCDPARFTVKADLAADLADALDDPRWDEEIRAESDEALSLTGKDVGTPIIQFSPPEGTAFFGPVISRLPAPEDAGRLWD